MEILQQTTIENILLLPGDSWDIGNNTTVILKELFEIEGQVYMTTITDGHPMNGIKINPEDTEIITPNRYINLAEVWVKKNKHLFV